MELVREGNVGSEAAVAADQRRILQPLDRLPDPFVVAGRHRPAPILAAAMTSWTPGRRPLIADVTSSLMPPPVRARGVRRCAGGLGGRSRWYWHPRADRPRMPPPRPPPRRRHGRGDAPRELARPAQSGAASPRPHPPPPAAPRSHRVARETSPAPWRAQNRRRGD